MSTKLKVAIVGGGMGGLCLAVALLRAGITVDIFEQAGRFEEIGAGVGIGPNGIRALRKLGILDHVLRVADEPLARRMVLFMSGLPDHNIIYDYPGLDTDYGLGVHRARFLDALTKLLPSSVAHFKKKCTSVLAAEDDPAGRSGVSVFFEDGTSHTADVVIGCDGVKSAIRTAVVGTVIQPKFTRTIAFRGLISIEAGVKAMGPLIRKRPHAYVGPHRHLVVFPINGGETVNIVAFSTDRTPAGELGGPEPGQPWVVPATRDEMLSHFEGWGPQVTELLSNITHPNKWFLHMLDPPLETYVNGKVAILGDAAHAMLPHLGAGAGQAIEDAYILSILLSHPQTTNLNVESVLKAYDHVRRPRANRVVRRSWECGEIYEHCGPSGSEQVNIRQDLQDTCSFVWHHDLERDIESATDYLVEQSVFMPSATPSNALAKATERGYLGGPIAFRQLEAYPLFQDLCQPPLRPPAYWDVSATDVVVPGASRCCSGSRDG